MISKLFAILVLSVSAQCGPNNNEAGYLLAKEGLTQYLSTGYRPSYLDRALQQFKLPYLFRAEPGTFDDSQVCSLCEIVAEIIITERKMGMSDVQIAAEVAYFCEALGIENERVCNGIVEINVDIFTYIIDNDKTLTGKKFCGLVLQTSNCDNDGNYEWTIDIPPGETVEKTKATETNTFNILHISDIHYDPLYAPGKSSSCGEPLCCQIDQADATGEADACGYWSHSAHSDVPLHTVHETLNRTTKHEFDYVYYTGDFISHRVWATSVANNSRDITTITKLFKEYYSVPVYPVLGNHEPHPLNVWSSNGVSDTTVSTQWLYDLVAEQWSDWLTEEAKATLIKGGFYTVSPKKGFRVIVLNSNVCYVENWWLVFDNKDPQGQLAWLAETLLAAEQNKESVHILSHLPTGTGSCLVAWAREYGRIIQRFANTITGQFNGHSHRDTFSIYYNSSDSSQAINMVWNGASVIVDSANPSYKLYKIDDNTFDILDYDEWTFNLTVANSDPEKPVEWYKLYSFRDAYGVKSLEPSEVDSLANRMTQNHTLIDMFHNYKFRNSDLAVKGGCNADCHREILCSIVTTVYGENQQCEKLLALYNGS